MAAGPLANVLHELAALDDPAMRAANERRGDDPGVNLTQLRAVAKRERLGIFIDYPASPGCTPPYVSLWIAEMVRRREGTAAPQRRGRSRATRA